MTPRSVPHVGLRAAVFTLLLAGAAGCSDALEVEVDLEGRPNVVLVLIDDLRWDALGATGHPFTQTPHFDRLAAEGVTFENAFVVNSLCSPSRATTLTGLYSHATGVIDNQTPLPRRYPTTAQLLQALGYATAFIGKWHMGTNGAPEPGFDRWVSFEGQGVYDDPILNVDGERQQFEGYMTTLLTDLSLDFLESRPPEVPFFLTVSHKAVHAVTVPDERFAGMYAGAPVALPPTFRDDLSGKPSFLRRMTIGVDSATFAGRMRRYHETLFSVDESIGRILTELEEQGVLDETLVLVMGDNGFLLGAHGLTDKRLAYEESIRVPIIARFPKWFIGGSRSDNLALNLDVAATITDAAGIEELGTGTSLRRVTYGGARTAFLYEYFWEDVAPEIPTLRAVRTGRYKYITYLGAASTDELYDLATDPWETTNLIDDPAHATTLATMKELLSRLRSETGDTM